MRSKIVQIVATLSGALATFTTGQLMGWASPSLAILMGPNSPIPGGVTSAQASWIASLVMVGNVFGSPLAAYTVDKIGRKTVVLISAFPVLISWILVTYAPTIEILYLARFIGGIGESYGKATMFMYVGEIAEASIRGALGTFLAITLNVGILFEYSIGPFVSYEHLSLVSAVVPIVLFITFFSMPESPYYLVMHGKNFEAERSLQILRRSQNVEAELEEIQGMLAARLTFRKAFKALFGDRVSRNCLFITCMLFFSQEMSGITPNIMYAKKILEETHIGHLPPELAPIIIPLMKILATLVTMVLVDRTGRRPLYMISCSASALAMGVLSAYFYFKEMTTYSMVGLDWIPLTMMSIFNVMFIFGLGCLPFIMIGELFSTNVKALAVCITAMVGPLSSVLATKLFQIMSDAFGVYSAFALFAVLCLGSFIFVTLFLPETKNQTLAEIQHILQK